MRKTIPIVLSLVVVLILAAPFLRDAWKWHEIRGEYSLSETERAELQNWQGSPESFIEMLRAKCREGHPDTPQACAQYQ